MDIHHLKIFSSVYREKSFTKASSALHISQPTISEHIKNLEKELGCNLFDRLGRTIIPTKEADFLFPRALKIMEDIDRLHDDLFSTSDEIKGEIIIGASTIPGTYILPSLAVQFKKKHPGVSFEIKIEDTERITRMVLNHELLCAVVGARMEPEKLYYIPIVEDELVLVGLDTVIPDNIGSIIDLYHLPFLNREKGSGTRKIMEDFLARAGAEPDRLDIVATLGSTAAVKEAVKAGLGVSILSRLAVQEELHKGSFRILPIKGLAMKRSFYWIGHKKRTLPNQYQAFNTFITKSL
ncbi:MAG: LysR family transcriptional regulator [Proteobacteria bacterium]|nr:LysR family transcriptional regulator [Pseudomonadota bacterium]MBU1711169.1 LysR family transcriptional regulator [Pseudomonadota bacterium]